MDKYIFRSSKFNVKYNIIFILTLALLKYQKIEIMISEKRTRHSDGMLFCTTNLVNAKEVAVKCFPMDMILVDLVSKLSVGSKNYFKT